MARTSESAIQRLQVGLIGLLAVVIFVSMASMLFDSAEGPAKTTAVEAAPAAADVKAASDEATVELGVTPVVPEQPGKQKMKAAPPPATNTQR